MNEEVEKSYKFFNKPFGLLHWIWQERGLTKGNKGETLDEDAVVILLDPDMIFLRPILKDFSNKNEVIFSKKTDMNRKYSVEHGSPFAQRYGFGGQWLRQDLSYVVEHDSPALNVTKKEAEIAYPAGPPYIATLRDMFKIAVKWTEYVPRVHTKNPSLMAEMYAYSIGAAHEKLPHQLIQSLMISDSHVGDEGWPLIDNVPGKDICRFAIHSNHSQNPMPNVLHYCQRYMVGDWFFAKRSFPLNFFTCETPLLALPPMDLALKFDYKMPPRPHPIPGQRKPTSSKAAKRDTFVLCILLSALNKAREHFKKNSCTTVKDSRTDKPIKLWNLGDFQKQDYHPTPKKSIQKAEETQYHTVFSTDCSKYHDWQSYLLFHSALNVGQPGTVTRIVSGCSKEEESNLKKWHDTHIKMTMSNQYRLHFTPDYSKMNEEVEKSYEFFNKPFGLLHWIWQERGLTKGNKGETLDEDAVVILLDPDMIFLRPILKDFSNKNEVIFSKKSDMKRKYSVEHGSPFAQRYGFGGQWLKQNLSYIVEHDSPALNVTKKEAEIAYPAGPPYIATLRDMHKIAVKWTEYVPRVHTKNPSLMAEMYAYSIGAAHEKLPHQLIDSLMVSDASSEHEAWPLINNFPAEEACTVTSHSDAVSSERNHSPFPNIIHYCQRNMVGDWFFGKRRLPEDIFTCDSPLR